MYRLGSRDPYVVTGYGAGFVMCWRNDVKWRVCQEDDPRKFMTVDSGEYVLAIPDYSHHARRGMNAERPRADTVSTNSTFRSDALFKKVIMKLAGNVQWLAGLVFERNLAGGGRAFDFRPHYKVVLKTPNFARAPEGEVSYSPRNKTNETLIVLPRHTMRSEASAVTTSICPLLLLPQLTGTGRYRIWRHRKTGTRFT